MNAPHPAYDQLAAVSARLYRLDHLQSMVSWDQSVNMPRKGAGARADAMAELATVMHHLRSDPQRGEVIARAEQEPLDDDQRANLREIHREWQAAVLLPDALVKAQSLATSACEHAWRAQRPANDWAGFLENFRPVLALAREEATLRAAHSGGTRYDSLLDRFEPGMRSADIDRVFGHLRTWLPGLIVKARARQQTQLVIKPTGPFPIAQQRALCERVMRLLGFDFDGGRLDVSTHPFSGGVPEDVRLTTRYREDEFLQSLMSTIHETGHGRYEQNRPKDWLGQPLSQARSMGIHESQSLSFEMQLARSPQFAAVLQPLLVEQFGAQPAFEPDNLARLLTRVAPGLIRVDADEVTYPAHVILRYEIERALIDGDIEAEDIPALWDEKMQQLLGLDTRGNFRNGPLQDVHWPLGLIGYFPSYTLGAMYAAQWFATMRRSVPSIDNSIASGDLSPVFAWLDSHIWSQGSRFDTATLTQRATGEALNPEHFRAHLEARYLG
jgi:carboxypeptidase Taq